MLGPYNWMSRDMTGPGPQPLSSIPEASEKGKRASIRSSMRLVGFAVVSLELLSYASAAAFQSSAVAIQERFLVSLRISIGGRGSISGIPSLILTAPSYALLDNLGSGNVRCLGA